MSRTERLGPLKSKNIFFLNLRKHDCMQHLIYAPHIWKLRSFAGWRHVVDGHDTSRIVYNSCILRDSDSFTVLFHSIRLCGITELNIRGSRLKKAVSRGAQDGLAVCHITERAPRQTRDTCRSSCLTPDCDGCNQNRVLRTLTEVAWFSRRGPVAGIWV